MRKMFFFLIGIGLIIIVGTIMLILALDTGYKSPTATGEDYNQWTTPTRAYTLNGLYAFENTVTQEQDYYNFDFSIPSGATINGVEVLLTGQPFADIILGDDSASIKVDISDNGGTSYGTKIAKSWSTFDEFYDTAYGGATSGDAYWGLTLTDGDFSNANFRVRVELDALVGGTTSFWLDHIQVKVYYTGGAAPTDCWSYGTYGYYIPKNCTCYISGNAQILNLSNAYCWAG